MDPGDHPVVPVPLRADHPDLGAERRDHAYRARRHGLDELHRALQRRPHLRLDRPHQRRPRRVERRHQLAARRRRSISAATSTWSTNCATSAPTSSSMSSRGLWDCWEDGAIVADKATGHYIDADKVRPLDHQGRFFQVKGPINMARCPQGHPVDHPGRRLAFRARAGGAHRRRRVLGGAGTGQRPEAAYADLKGRMAKYGRAPDQLAVLPGVMPIIGRQRGRGAATSCAKLQSWLTPTNAADAG